uniref:Uncharacterized protein n=1 Tax=Arundo donax TaxID=35708 RepID=A0A0A9E8W1_ARUDO
MGVNMVTKSWKVLHMLLMARARSQLRIYADCQELLQKAI